MIDVWCGYGGWCMVCGNCGEWFVGFVFCVIDCVG